MRTPTTLSIDVGSTNVKAQTVGPRGAPRSDRIKFETPDPLTPRSLTAIIHDVAEPLRPFDRVSVGLPGIVHRGVVFALPVLGDHRLKRFRLADLLEKSLGRPVRLMNDAEMHALGVIQRQGAELILTFGTGLGTALFLNGERGGRMEFIPTPSGREPKGGVFGDASRKMLGNSEWSRRVMRLIEVLRETTNFDRCYVGGGNAKKLKGRLPRGVTKVDNSAATLGGVRLWDWDILT